MSTFFDEVQELRARYPDERSAVMPAGRGANGAYWFDTKTGAFASSTYYMPDVPAWVKAFNDRKLADSYAGQPWTPASGPAFKPIPPAGSAGFYDAVYGSPYGNNLLLEFASELLAREELGTRNATDLLSVSFSSNDSVGHAFGPDSPQVHDISLRTDRTIGMLLALVDKTVGLQRTIVALTADHAVAPVPEATRERGLPGGRMTSKELFDPIQQALAAKYGAGDWLLSTAGSFLIAASVLLFFAAVIVAFRRPPDAGPDPWEGNSLEWWADSPPPHHNFRSLPPIRSERPVFDAREGARASTSGVPPEPRP